MSLGSIILALTVYVLAVARVTRLVNHDTVADPVRLFIVGRARRAEAAAVEAERGDHPITTGLQRRRMARWNTVFEFVGCPWCVGFWVSAAGAVPVVGLVGWSWWAVVPVGLACSHLVGVAAPLSADALIEIVEDAG